MEKLFTCHDMTQIDTISQDTYAMPSLVLMENASQGAWHIIQSEFASHLDRLVVIAGGGNNGGDALAIARTAHIHGVAVQVIVASTHMSASCAVQYDICTRLGIEMVADEQAWQGVLSGSTLVVDGLLGTGCSRPLSGLQATLVEAVNAQQVPVISLDIPSGMGDAVASDSLVVHATMTISMGNAKLCCYHPSLRPWAGSIVQSDPGFPPIAFNTIHPAASLLDASDIHLKPVSPAAYKMTRPRVAVFAGSHQWSGAARLAARSAYHAQAGMVTLFADSTTFDLYAAETPCVIISALESPSPNLDHFDVLLVGPGWGTGHRELLCSLLSSNLPIVLDADGIKEYARLCAADSRWCTAHGPLLMTPHIGELRVLAQAIMGSGAKVVQGESTSEYESLLGELARRTHSSILAKSHVNWIHDGSQLQIVDGMFPALGVAGSGDVLSGICAAMLARGVAPSIAGTQGALLHRAAGEHALSTVGWFDAIQLCDAVGPALVHAQETKS